MTSVTQEFGVRPSSIAEIKFNAVIRNGHIREINLVVIAVKEIVIPSNECAIITNIAEECAKWTIIIKAK